MIDWLFLLVFVPAGGFLLVRGDLFRFRGSTLLGFLFLALGMTSPLALQPTRMMLDSGAGPDAYIGVWNLWWTRTALEQGHSPYENMLLFAPQGTSLALHTYSILYAVLSLPIQWLFSALGGPAYPVQEQLFTVYNLILIVSFTLSGYFTYRLAMEETGHRGASLLAGAIFAYSNFRFANTVRSHVIPGELVVLAVWAWVRLLKDPVPRRLVLWAGAMVLLIYGSLELAAYTLVLFMLLGLASAPDLKLTDLRQWSISLIATAAGSVIVLLPLLIPLIRRLGEGPMRFPPGMALFFSADLVDFILPNPRHPIWGEPFQGLTGMFHLGDSGFGLSLGLVSIVLLVLASRALLRERQDRRWFWGTIAFLILSLGPGLHLAGYVVPKLPLPQDWISRFLPFLAASRTPIRYMALASLCLSMTVACGWALRTRMEAEESRGSGWAGRNPAETGASSRTGWRAGGREAGLLAAILVASLSAPMAMVRVPLPAVYSKIAALSKDPAGSSALINIPSLPDRTELLYQTVHGRTLVADVSDAVPLRSERGPDASDSAAFKVLTRGLGSSDWWNAIPPNQRGAALGEIRAMLRLLGVRWIVLRQSLSQLSPDARGFQNQPLLSEKEFATFRARLNELGPVRVDEAEGVVLFEFETP